MNNENSNYLQFLTKDVSGNKIIVLVHVSCLIEETVSIFAFKF